MRMTRFQQEIEQMPDAIELLASYYQGEGGERLLAFRSRAAGRRSILFSGMGTSRFAPEVAFPRIARLGVSCASVDTGEWLHYDTCSPGAEDLVVLTSQSGESAEVKALVTQAKARPGFVAITNDESNTLARHAGLVLPLLAGEEMSISTKTYANTLAIMHLLAAVMEGDAALDDGIEDLRRAADALRGSSDDAIIAAAESLAGAAALAFVGRGPAYVTARQCALTFMEGTRCPSVAFSGGAFNHGPAEMLQPGSRLIVLRPDGLCSALMELLAERAAARGADVLMIGGTPARPLEGVTLIVVPGIESADDEEALFPLLACRTQNLLLYFAAAAGGHEAGIFRYGGKVTSHE
jgi:glutamine---fructose-6-phosphate transaminase (isomerizing)